MSLWRFISILQNTQGGIGSFEKVRFHPGQSIFINLNTVEYRALS